MKRFLILTLTTAVFAVALLVGPPASAQSSSSTTSTAVVTPSPEPIHWRLVPGALYPTANGMGLSVACQVTSRDADFTGRPSIVNVRLKIQQPPKPEEGRPYWTDVWNWNSYPDPARGFRPCNLAKGVDLLEWDHISFRDGLLELGAAPALIETLRVVVRYYKPERGYPDHNGLHLQSQYGNFLSGYIDLVNNNTVSPTAATEDAADFGW